MRRFEVRSLLVSGLLASVASIACAAGPTVPRFADATGELPSLQPLERVRFASAWARPGVVFADYRDIQVRYAELSYREEPLHLARRGRARGGNYALSEDVFSRLNELVPETFGRELADSEVWFSSSRSADSVLELRIQVRDLRIDEPLSSTDAQDTAVAASLGALTLLVDLHDAATGEWLARIAERRRIETGTGRPIEVTAGDALYEARRIYRRWARELRGFLQGLPQLGAS